MRIHLYCFKCRENGCYIGIGVISSLSVRLKKKIGSSVFSKRFNFTDLVYYECFETIMEAIKREKLLKKWKREWNFKLIESKNLGYWIFMMK